MQRARHPLATLALTAMALSASHGWAVEPIAIRNQLLETPDGARRVTLPDNLQLEVLSTALSRPRMLTLAPDGALLVGSRAGVVYRLEAPYTEPQVFARLGDYPHSVAVRGDELLIAQTRGLYRTRFRAGERRLEGALELVAALPGGFGHSSRTVRVGPDRRIYLSLGISGNCSDQYLGEPYAAADRRGGIVRLIEARGRPRWEAFATGLRNPVGFDWHPTTGVAYASNNGPDHLGFEHPREVFARLDEGSFHGMPWFWHDGDEVVRDRCIGGVPPRPASEVSKPAATFPARNAPMAVAFVPHGALVPELEGDAVVALRGSWAIRPASDGSGKPGFRRPPRLVVVRFESGQPVAVEELLTGFQDAEGERWARPVGLAFGPDGALYFTSDEGTQGLFRLRPR
jgi:glucose/arabinose dehydrogenase